jgi:hypothetical protein
VKVYDLNIIALRKTCLVVNLTLVMRPLNMKRRCMGIAHGTCCQSFLRTGTGAIQSQRKLFTEGRKSGAEKAEVGLVTLFPMIACLYAIYRWSTQVAWLYVVLPTMLLMPTYYILTIRPAPGVNFIETALLGLLLGMLVFDVVRWKLSLMDLWVVLFVLSTGYANFHNGRTTDAAFAWFQSVIRGLIPYMAGKLLIEQMGNRLKFIRLFLLLIAIGAAISSYEFIFRHNPYASFFNHFYPTQYSPNTTQVRWGFGRVAGPFTQSELAGMMMLTAWLLSLWLGRTNFQEKAYGILPASLLKNGKYWIWGMFAALYMTQARGPWIGAGLGAMIAAIGRAKRPGLRAATVIAAVVLIGIPVYTFGKNYLAGPRKSYGSEKETAQYREELITNYVPVAEKGGAWGWGGNFPVVDGQTSVDNEYLLVWLNQGYVGAVALLLMMAGSLGRLVVQSVRATHVRELHFYTTIMGIVAGIAFTITTVYLGAQSYELLFLLVGWVQAIHAPRFVVSIQQNVEIYRPATESEYFHVYS